MEWAAPPFPALPMIQSSAPKILIVDLNNFAYYPTIAIGYMVAALRQASFDVEILSPLAHGVPSAQREKQETLRDHLYRRVSFSTQPWLLRPRAILGRARSSWKARPEMRVDQALEDAIAARRPDAVLVSTYTDSYPLVERLCEVTRKASIPTLLGGPILNQREVAEEWRDLPGIRGIVGGEVERTIVDIVTSMLADGDLTSYPGFLAPDGSAGPPAASLRDLESLPHPDYSDFPWDAYPNRIIPILTARGCGWSRCTFCGDIVTANGRGFRSRGWDSVAKELTEQSARYGTSNFTFLDIKLNSDLGIWRALQTELPKILPDARWLATLHVGPEEDNGLSPEDMRRAYGAGLRRVTFGMESGSQHLLDAMDKGTQLDRNTEFIEAAAAANLSVRCTVMQGYPGETAEDLVATASYLEEHGQHLDRVRINRFNVLVGTRFATEYARQPEAFPSLVDLDWEYRFARSSYRFLPAEQPDYRSAMARLLKAVYRINRKPLKEEARVFDGVM